MDVSRESSTRRITSSAGCHVPEVVLKNHIHQVFINEDLQKTTTDLFRQARGLIKEHKLHGAWTAYGTLYVKTGHSKTPVRVSSPADLVGI